MEVIKVPGIIISECNNNFELAFRKFKRSCEKAGILSRLRQIEYFEKPTEKRKRMKIAAVKRHLKKTYQNKNIFLKKRVRKIFINQEGIIQVLNEYKKQLVKNNT